MSQNISKLSGRKGLADNLFERITACSEQHHVPDSEQLGIIARDYLVGKSTVAGSLSFYDFLSDEHTHKQAFVCNGSACLCAGTQQNVYDTLSATLGEDNIGHITCLGRCHENASFQLNGKNYSGSAINHLDQIFQEPTIYQQDEYYIEAVSSPLLTSAFCDIEAFRLRLQHALAEGAFSLLNEIKTSNLRGRGGAGFPTGMAFARGGSVPTRSKTISSSSSFNISISLF